MVISRCSNLDSSSEIFSWRELSADEDLVVVVVVVVICICNFDIWDWGPPESEKGKNKQKDADFIQPRKGKKLLNLHHKHFSTYKRSNKLLSPHSKLKEFNFSKYKYKGFLWVYSITYICSVIKQKRGEIRQKGRKMERKEGRKETGKESEERKEIETRKYKTRMKTERKEEKTKKEERMGIRKKLNQKI